MSDIVDRLREQGEWRSDKAWDGCPIAEEAAKEITRLREENARLRKALKPFVKTLELNCTEADPDDFFIDQAGALLVSDLRAAKAAIREGGNDEN